ncbi:hypothetical protein M3F59_07000 [Brachybacterium muris]|uniref:hypothetical protein n=1 Tax=Brachybacterium muris TaxID=219301 RepID=UPI00223AAC59|nr:hypothetical protein [Brachybacterium muris]MCT2261368.1 hypothetical protein [Brachybacterium muris]
MSTTMRTSFRTAARTTAHRAGRTAAVGLGGLVLALGAAACTGGDEEPAAPPAAEETAEAEPTTELAEEPTSEEPTEESSASDGGGDAAVSEQDLTVAKERFVSFMQVVDDPDYEAACGYMLDPSTGEPPVGAELAACAESLEQELGSSVDVEPGTFDALDASMVEASADDSDAVTISFGGSQFPVPMTKHTDGQWYFTTPDLGG